MKNAFLFIVLAATIGCSNSKRTQDGNDGAFPACLSRQIKSFENSQNAPIRIDEYTYKGQRTFLFIADCCDQYNTLYDENCKQICSPSGGLTGAGDQKCTDFSKESRLVKTVWTKPGK